MSEECDSFPSWGTCLVIVLSGEVVLAINGKTEEGDQDKSSSPQMTVGAFGKGWESDRALKAK